MTSPKVASTMLPSPVTIPYHSVSIVAPIPVANTGKGFISIGSLGLIWRGLGFVEKKVVLVGRVLDLKSTIGLMLGLASTSMLLLRKWGFGDTVEKRRKRRFANLTILLGNPNLMMFFLRWMPK